MTTIAGASQYYNSAVLARTQNLSPSIPTLISQSTDALSILDAGRNALQQKGIGISANARAYTDMFLSQSNSYGKELLSLAAGVDSTIEGAQIKIKALRSTLPISMISRHLIEIEEAADSGSADPNTNIIDLTA